MLDTEFKYFVEHQDELVKKYPNLFVVIKNQQVIGSYKSEIEAYNETIKKHEAGTFLIQLCIPGKESYTQTFHSRVVFS